jgi:O-antigen/teichoic acid export membrane protein
MLFKTYALLKYVGLILGVGGAFLQPALFSRHMSHDDFALLSFLYGIIAYLAFCDFGMHKPIYSALRKAHVSGGRVRKKLQTYLSLYLLILVMVGVFFAAVLMVMPGREIYRISRPTLGFFAFAASANLFLNYIEYIFNALELQVVFQKIDISRRAANIFSLLFLLVDSSFFLTICVNVALLTGCCSYAIRSLGHRYGVQPQLDLKTSWALVRRLWSKSRDSLTLTMSDTLIYNFGFLILPFFLGPADIISYSLWLKVFFGGALIIRIIIDIYIHDITRFHFLGEPSRAAALLRKSIYLSLLLALGFSLAFFLVKTVLFAVWVQNVSAFSDHQYASLGIWLGALAIQGSAGTFLLSQGGSFAFMRNTSLWLMLAVCSAFTALVASRVPLGTTLLFVGMINLVGSFVYLKKSTAVVKVEGVVL